MLKRALLILTAVVLATAAPLRAWCEADCLAPAHTETTDNASHCQTAEPDHDTTSMSGTAIVDCPTVESARPTAPAKPMAPAIVPSHPSALAHSHVRPLAPSYLHILAPKPHAAVPLRI